MGSGLVKKLRHRSDAYIPAVAFTAGGNDPRVIERPLGHSSALSEQSLAPDSHRQNHRLRTLRDGILQAFALDCSQRRRNSPGCSGHDAA